MTKSRAVLPVSDAHTSIVQAVAMTEDIPHVENRDRAFHHITAALTKLAEAIEALAEG